MAGNVSNGTHFAALISQVIINASHNIRQKQATSRQMSSMMPEADDKLNWRLKWGYNQTAIPRGHCLRSSKQACSQSSNHHGSVAA
jgi:hypothetical protein